MPHLARAVVVTAAAGYTALQILGRRGGATGHERKASLPGDDVVPAPRLVTDHAITIAAPAQRVWPWLTQMGWHLGGYYSPAWVDRLLFPQNWPSLDHLDPALLRRLQVGDVIPDGEPGTASYVVHQVEAPHVLVLRSTTHVPPGWDVKYGASLLWTWTFVLTDLSDGRCRLHLRVRGRTSPWWFTALYEAAVVPSDAVMAIGMLHGLRGRVEADPAPRLSGRHPYVPAAPASAA
jgi:hypothetical protein